MIALLPIVAQFDCPQLDLDGLEQLPIAESLHALSNGTVLQQWQPQSGQLLSLVAYAEGGLLHGWYTGAERRLLISAAASPQDLTLLHHNLDSPLQVSIAELSFAPVSTRAKWTPGTYFSGSVKLRVL